MKWKRLGMVYNPDGRFEWAQSHASYPAVERLDDDHYRIYFSARDSNNKSSIGYVVIRIDDPFNILEVSNDPVLAPSQPGLFDDSGISMGSIVQAGSKKHIYYIGWELGVTRPWKNFIGVATNNLENDGFRRPFHTPVLDRTDSESYSLSYPWVMRKGSSWIMWYGSYLTSSVNPKSVIHKLYYAVSSDGIAWERKGMVVLPFSTPGENTIVRPTVLLDGDRYKMWFAYRGENYQIGYAESEDGILWERMDSVAGFKSSGTGWDSDSVTYPCVFQHEGTQYMLYNGNKYGKKGFGLAVWE